ncbi:MAG TPA: sulfur oxidation c-type cytochrome SoxA [Caldimonas sp.]|jgi:sulfur-oxidizing protein SoxA|nr:sulfur oxidation c-type cytochrome SoxA [Caldimonas sp.]HEX2540334.1 sulfur oxidation c-type cytochrome SoxA [Caldimonas sp.]
MNRSAGAAAAATLLAVAVAACTLAGSAPSPRTPTSAGADTRRPGSDDMSAALQSLQRDDTQNPGMLWVHEGERLWARPAGNGGSCAGCHASGGASVASAAARHPVFDAEKQRPLTLAGRIDRCRQRHLGLPGEGADGAEVLALSAWLAHRARGLPIESPDDARLAPWRERGEALWRRRMGQLDLSCHLCHDQRAGERLGGAVIPQGHPTGYPAYRLEWQTLGSLQRRIRGCLVGVRAEPFAADADESLALEVWLRRRAAGMRIEGVAVRP